MLTDDLEQRLKLYVRWMVRLSSLPEVRAISRPAFSAWRDPADVATRQGILGYTEM